MTAIAATIACGIACATLVAAEWRGLRGLRVAAKVAASGSFLVVAAVVHTPSPYASWLLVGLAFGALGDLFLLGRGSRMFLGGLVAFLIGHVAYVGGLAQLVEPARWPAAAGAYALLPIAVALAALARLWPRLGAMRVPVIVYIAAIVAMVVGAIAAGRTGALPDPQRTRLVAGAALFFVSDLAVARERFLTHGFANKLWGLPAYFTGQLLLAWSLA